MKHYLINHSLQLIQEYHPEYDETKLAEIEYGLVGIYLTYTKLFIIGVIAILLHLFQEFLIFLVIYNIIRTFSFGLHATKTWICLVSSILIFIGLPLICKYVTIPLFVKIGISIVTIYQIFQHSPADTEKRPIINPKRRFVYRLISTIIAIIYAYMAILIQDNFLSNCFIFAPIVQCFLISPSIYALFGLPYDNYKLYLAKEKMV